VLKGLVRHRIAARLERRVREHGALSVPWWLFTMVPASYWQRVSDQVFAPSERAAARVLAQEHPLKAILTETDLANAAAVTPVTIIEIWRLLMATRPHAILELGCGVSTLVFSYYASECARTSATTPAVYSIEHSPEWIGIVAQRLAALKLASHVTLIEAPLKKVHIAGVDTECYDSAALSGRLAEASVDFCLIDGPPAIQDPLSRVGCLPLISRCLARGSTVLLDNTARDGERQAIAAWRRMYPSQLGSVSGAFTSSGFASFVWAPHTASS
jgi:predicted O-methyltransferase YrrM